MRWLIVSLSLFILSFAGSAKDPWKFVSGDRVALLGSTLIEREQKYAHWEESLMRHNPGVDVRFRNLGWSGDTVYGDARAGFDSAKQGYERLVKLTIEVKPTVIVVCYGFNESFAGEAGEKPFETQFIKLLKDLESTKARIVIVSPIPMEPSPGRPDVSTVNASLSRYVGILKATAEKEKLDYVPLFERTRDAGGRFTENGLHPDETGYQKLTGLLFETTPPTTGRAEVRAKIIEKNQLFFHRWRPQNETYLFGFRKHEQGNNSVEIPQFDPLVVKAEEQLIEMMKR
jgi:lysophospholipase L1-like esterase